MSELADAATALLEHIDESIQAAGFAQTPTHSTVERLRAALAADAQRSADIKAKRIGPEQWRVEAPWGTLFTDGSNIYGLQSLWLPNVSMSPSMAKDLAYQLDLAGQVADLSEEE